MSKRDPARAEVRAAERLTREVEAALLDAEQRGLVRKAGERNGETVWQLTEAGEASVRKMGSP